MREGLPYNGGNPIKYEGQVKGFFPYSNNVTYPYTIYLPTINLTSTIFILPLSLHLTSNTPLYTICLNSSASYRVVLMYTNGPPQANNMGFRQTPQLKGYICGPYINKTLWATSAWLFQGNIYDPHTSFFSSKNIIFMPQFSQKTMLRPLGDVTPFISSKTSFLCLNLARKRC